MQNDLVIAQRDREVLAAGDEADIIAELADIQLEAEWNRQALLDGDASGLVSLSSVEMCGCENEENEREPHLVTSAADRLEREAISANDYAGR